MSRKHIAIFCENLYGGGVEKILQIILKNFDYDKFDITLYSNRKEILNNNYYPNRFNYKYIFETIPKKGKLKAFWYKAKNKFKLWIYYNFKTQIFYNLFIHKRYDIGIAFIEGYSTRLVAGMSNKTPKIAWVHTDMMHNHWTPISYRNNKEEKDLYQKFQKIICVSNTVKENLDTLYNTQDKTTIILNPIDRDYIISLSNIKTSIYTKHPSRKRIITLGSLIEIKGYDRLLRIAKVLKNNHNVDFELLILGEGKLRKSFEQYIESNDLCNHVYLTGYINNPYPYILNSDIYVCSSYAEGFNTAITESLILGKAIVATDCSGVKEQLGKNCEYGICTQNTEKDLFEGIIKMLNNETQKYYEKKAKERGKMFALENSMNEIYKILN